MRGLLSQEELERIDSILPQFDFMNFHTIVDQFYITAITYDLYTKTSFYHISAICLSDAGHRFAQVRMGLHESYACLEYYAKQPKSEMAGIHTAKFYADYVALIFYAIGEDIAEFIKFFLGIQPADFNDPVVKQKLENAKVSSQQGKVGIYLKTKHPNDDITKIIAKLYCKDWNKVIDYRNDWVHDKPPIIAGLGIQYNRENKIKKTEGGYSVTWGGGDKHEYEIDELQEMVNKASLLVSEVLLELLDVLIKKEQELIKTCPLLLYRTKR